MRCGILMIGSLLWDNTIEDRADWRAARLDFRGRVHVRVPLHYARKSRSWGHTYTMAFRPGEPSGQGVLVPCSATTDTIEVLMGEAQALWKAEDRNANPGKIGKPWGCVGALFSEDTADSGLAADWTAQFKESKTQSISVINTEGMLDIEWPNGLDGKPADFDVILATATKPEDEAPTAIAIADAWIEQSEGHEKYFFQNVRHGIRTPDDMEIWRRIEKCSPDWIGSSNHETAIEILRADSVASDVK